MLSDMALNFNEKVIFTLRSLYSKYGYSRYKMSKFEEYDLYARNKDFLISDSVITFTDTNGKLMALKPDVTLSIVKNVKADLSGVQKLYYDENVYRVSKSTKSFKEIMQLGLECIGEIDNYCICEVIYLAAKSLKCVSDECVLDVSHLGLLTAVINEIGVPDEKKSSILKCIGEKNVHELKEICAESGVSKEYANLITELISINGAPNETLPSIKNLLKDIGCEREINELETIMSALESSDAYSALRIDFSVVDDIHYYNGIVFKGFVHGVPGGVLSGGQYDKLMRKMGQQSCAIGFAVYMDMLERLDLNRKEYDVDVLLLYDEYDDLAALWKRVTELAESGLNVIAGKDKTSNVKYKKIITFRESEGL